MLARSIGLAVCFTVQATMASPEDVSFTLRGSFGAGISPTSLAIGDFNGDGISDVAVTNYVVPGTVSVLLANPDHTLQPPRAFLVGDLPSSVATADLNQDGRLDLVVANAGSQTVSVLLGNGDGTFQAAQSFAVGNGPAAVVVGDFNG